MVLEEYLTLLRRALENSTLVTGQQKAMFLQACDQLIAHVHDVWTTDWRQLRLHGDLHAGNILGRDGPTIQDLWMLFNGDRRDRLYQLSLLLDAYAEFMDFDPRELALIEPLRAMRMIHYFAWVSWRWSDPAFSRSFPWMVEVEFWSQQTALFIERTRNAVATVSAAADAGILIVFTALLNKSTF